VDDETYTFEEVAALLKVCFPIAYIACARTLAWPFVLHISCVDSGGCGVAHVRVSLSLFLQ
jgi:hypothetical protein